VGAVVVVKDTADIVSNLHLALSSHHVSQRSAPRFLSGVLCSLMGPSGQELAVGEPVITAAFPIPCVPVGSPSSVSLYSPQLIFFFFQGVFLLLYFVDLGQRVGLWQFLFFV